MWLAVEEFPGGELDLPTQLLALKLNGLSIEWCHNIKSYKKLIPALKAYPDSVIVTADDDIIYKNNWLEQLVEAHRKFPRLIHCHRARRIFFNNDNTLRRYTRWPIIKKVMPESYKNFFNGCGGVLYPPSCLHPDVVDESLFQKLCPIGDDIWFWGMAVRNKIKIKLVPRSDFELTTVSGSQNSALWLINAHGENDRMLEALLSHYPDIKQIMKRD